MIAVEVKSEGYIAFVLLQNAPLQWTEFVINLAMLECKIR